MKSTGTIMLYVYRSLPYGLANYNTTKNTPGIAPGGVLLSPMQEVAVYDSEPHRLPIKAQRAMDQLPAFTNLRITVASSPCILMKYRP